MTRFFFVVVYFLHLLLLFFYNIHILHTRVREDRFKMQKYIIQCVKNKSQVFPLKSRLLNFVAPDSYRS